MRQPAAAQNKADLLVTAVEVSVCGWDETE